MVERKVEVCGTWQFVVVQRVASVIGQANQRIDVTNRYVDVILEHVEDERFSRQVATVGKELEEDVWLDENLDDDTIT